MGMQMKKAKKANPVAPRGKTLDEQRLEILRTYTPPPPPPLKGVRAPAGYVLTTRTFATYSAFEDPLD